MLSIDDALIRLTFPHQNTKQGKALLHLENISFQFQFE